jgi:ribonucleoside-diphosphate reductase alpha chain
MPVDDVFNIYMSAWKEGLKGITIYRNGCKREGILITDLPKPDEIPTTKAPKRPKELEADFYTVMSKGKQYIVLVGLLNNKPYEIFAFEPNIKLSANSHKGIITKKSKMHYSYKSDVLQITDLELANENLEEKAATLYASMLLRHGVDIKYIIKTAKKVNSNITSFSSAMCRILAKYIPTETTGEKCPDCGGDLIKEGGCTHCKDCGWSKCE